MSLLLIDGNNRFRKNFEKIGTQALSILYNQSISFDPNVKIIWIWDGENGSGKRRSIFPAYKGERTNQPTDDFYLTTKWFKELLVHSNCLQIEVPGYEADDVIAMLALHSNDQVIIDSNDADFLALVSDRVKVQRDPMEGVEAHFVRLYKTLVGDNSDNIKGIKGFGEKAWKDLLDSERYLLINHFKKEHILSADDVTELCGFSKSTATFWGDNQGLLQQYWDIVGFLDVPLDLLQKHIKAGVHNPAAFQAQLTQQLLSPRPAMGDVA